MQSTKALVAVVEDDDGMRRSIERLLRANGYATAAFSNAEEFLQNFVFENAIGLVLDIHLGGMSGIELRRRLSAAGSHIPVVFITAHDDDATRAAARAVGCVDYLEKPFESERLIRALERGAAS
jgi:FixJ family two-component response regulator